jgi:threonine aldolase
MDFRSDNVHGVLPEIMAALAAANGGTASGYGEDPISARLTERMSRLFEREVVVLPIATGSAANSLALSLLSPPWGVIYCHEDAHVEVDECAGPEFFTGGAKLRPLSGEQGKLSAETLERRLASEPIGVVHHAQPAAVTIAQITEWGTAYRPEEVAAIGRVARRYRLRLHMDGARFANALAFLGCKPADITWRAGVDVLSFGATKGGAMGAEAVVLFDRDLATETAFRRKRAGHQFSKMRFVAAQLDAYLTNDLWLRAAARANGEAAALARGLAQIEGVSLAAPVEGNQVFVRLPLPAIEALEKDGGRFYRWGGEHPDVIRLVTAFDTERAEVEAFVAAVRRRMNGA